MSLVQFISSERLETYEKHTDNQKRAIALHNHTLQLGSSLMSLIALLELALRNSTNQRLVDDFGDEGWLLEGRTTIDLKSFECKAVSMARSHAQKAAYAKLSYKQKGHLDAFAFPGWVPANLAHEKIAKERQKLFVVSHGQIISQTNFSFWKKLYSKDYENDLWKPSLKKVFPDKTLKRSDISSALEVIYATRNRVAHHEPVYGQRLDDVMRALSFIRKSLGPPNKAGETSFERFSKIQYLRLRMDYESFVEAWRALT